MRVNFIFYKNIGMCIFLLEDGDLLQWWGISFIDYLKYGISCREFIGCLVSIL